jgi:hypothetical protein
MWWLTCELFHMKFRSALQQSRAALLVGAPFVALFAGIVWLWPNWLTYVLFGVLIFGMLGDVINILYIRRKVARDPSALDREV